MVHSSTNNTDDQQVKTKVIKGSEGKTSATEAKSEAFDEANEEEA